MVLGKEFFGVYRANIPLQQSRRPTRSADYPLIHRDNIVVSPESYIWFRERFDAFTETMRYFLVERRKERNSSRR